jgi:predicted transcriptional regulator
MISIEARKLAVIEFLVTLTDEQIIQKFETLKQTVTEEHKTDFWEDLPQSTKDGYHKGMKDIEAGNLVPMEEVLKKYR